MAVLRFVIGWLLVAAGIIVAYAFAEAWRDPVVRHAHIAVTGWPAGQAPTRVLVMSDIHIGNATMTEGRLSRLVAQANALHPDLVLLAGDFISGSEPGRADSIAPALRKPLRGLRARLGIVAVPGNHDHATGIAAVRHALGEAEVTVLANNAVRRGPLLVIGVDDAASDHADVHATRAALRGLGGIPLVVTHSPDIVPKLPADWPLAIAGHTHCGQVVLPLYGAPITVSRYGNRYRCGIKREGRRITIVTGGLGTSDMPFRLGAPPDLWVLDLGSVTPAAASLTR